MVQFDPNAPPALDGGPATTGSRGLAADSGNKPKLGGNSPTPRQALIGGACSSTATGTNTTTAINFCPLQVTDVSGAVGGSGSTSHYSKWTAGSQLGNAFITDSTAQPQVNGSISMGTANYDYAGSSLYSAMDLPRGDIVFSNTDTNDPICLFSNGRQSPTGQTYIHTGVAAGLCIQSGSLLGLTAPSGTAGAAISWATQGLVRGIYSAQISTATPTQGDSWNNFLSVNTSSAAGHIVAMGAITLTVASPPGQCDARIILDGGTGYVAGSSSVRGYISSGNSIGISLSPSFTAATPAGGHSVILQVLAYNSVQCLAQVGYNYQTSGSLIVTEYTN
jgi:hypothetical protein